MNDFEKQLLLEFLAENWGDFEAFLQQYDLPVQAAERIYDALKFC